MRTLAFLISKAVVSLLRPFLPLMQKVHKPFPDFYLSHSVHRSCVVILGFLCENSATSTKRKRPGDQLLQTWRLYQSRLALVNGAKLGLHFSCQCTDFVKQAVKCKDSNSLCVLELLKLDSIGTAVVVLFWNNFLVVFIFFTIYPAVNGDLRSV